MTKDLACTNLQNDQPGRIDREKARKLFERSLHLDIFNVGSVTESCQGE